MDDNVRNPEMFDDIRSDINFSSKPSSLESGGHIINYLNENKCLLLILICVPAPVCTIIEHHSVFWPPHVVAKSQADLLRSEKYCEILFYTAFLLCPLFRQK